MGVDGGCGNHFVATPFYFQLKEEEQCIIQ